MSATPVEAVAEKVRVALASADLEQFSHLLDPKVTWGAPGDPTPTCQNRSQVLSWYSNGRAAGRRADVQNVRAHGDKIIVTMIVTSPEAPEGWNRWQVLTVGNGVVTDIRGYETEADALAAAGVSNTDR